MLLYGEWPQGHWALDPSLVALYGTGPQAHWALGPDLEIQHLAPSPTGFMTLIQTPLVTQCEPNKHNRTILP